MRSVVVSTWNEPTSNLTCSLLQMIPAMVRAIFSLPNVRRSQGYSGELKR